MNKIQPNMQDRVKYAVLFWGFTVAIAPAVIAVTALAYANPFWFRASGFTFAKSVIRSMTKFRGSLVAPIIDKYLAFEVLKEA